ncbi:hypothetical protein MNEG_10929 [Monoraphidium neglectum]|uniref:J domain-containing protein n=1 Tax=Monoraphidium neglectum TaxID=145388 RepID=A0A0D2M058_9CHLO|nr:hypothetical protein MNEG_10929 [Monoraphidium neglectum]KIY97034.1 hypothetical protein MNEG_10929 [Monoraphidium neglectum]|eukprot:XP_013896054.1 hypothetical protein MNEG_10929 [Monoraphidium neglectum]
MPAPELLAAAATYKAEVEESGAGWGARDADEDDDEPLVGPPPPAFIEADAAAPDDARSAEVVRVLRVLREAVTGKGGGGAAAAAAAAGGPGAEADPYEVLGVAHTAAAAEVRKVYWRLSLLVHPDKCAHAGAGEAFQAVSKAAATLQDGAARKKVDEGREEAQLRRMALDVAAEHERRRQWAALRGEKLPPELEAAAAAAAAAAAGPAARESWMTELPPELDHLAGPAMEGPRQFSRFGIKKRGDTSAWTDTPEQAALRAAGLLPASANAPLAIAAAGPAGRLTGGEAAPAPGVAEAVREYNERNRPKSLLEQHKERQAAAAAAQKGGKAKKKEKSGEKGDKGKKEKEKGEKRPAAGPAEEDWVGKHPWRPFDRDKDLEIKATPKSTAAMLKDGAGLSSRFASGGR